ncbi:MAG: TatD DNase family protein [Akkermansiaceae bacterium]|jgi:TatD DNase family protein
MIDAHNHLQDPRFAGRQPEIVATMKNAGITGCVVNGTSEEDWPAVAKLAEDFPNFVHPAFGLHPWKVESRSPRWLETLTSYLEKHPHASIGECGLDRWMKNPDLESQHLVFRQHLELAVALNRPVTIHCLKAWGPLLDELRAAITLPKFLLHSFAGSQETAQECLKLGAFFSFSGYFLHPRKAKVREVFQSLPPDRILTETDAPDMPLPHPRFHFKEANHPANLSVVSKELSALTKVKESVLLNNAQRFFNPVEGADN